MKLRWVRDGKFPAVLSIALLFPAASTAAVLQTTTLSAWDNYVAEASARMQQRLAPGQKFLWVDEAGGRLKQVRGGEVVVAQAGAENPRKVPSGLIHDWMGAVFIPGATLQDTLQVLRNYSRYKDEFRPSVIDSRLISRSDAEDRFSMRLLSNSFFKKTAFDTDYDSRFIHLDGSRAYSINRTTRVQEIDEYGSPGEHMLAQGEGAGLIWRMFSVARFAERDGGVYFETEVIALSRDIPASLRWLVDPIVRHFSRSALTVSLKETHQAVRSYVEVAKTGTGFMAASAAVPGGRGQARIEENREH